jgi:AAA domain
MGHMSSTPKDSDVGNLRALPPPPYDDTPWLKWSDLKKPLVRPDYFCERLGLVSGGGAPHMIAGNSFVGKSIALQSMVVSLCAGAKLWGEFPVTRPFKVAHIDLEQGPFTTAERYQRIAFDMRADESLLEENLAVKIYPKEFRLNDMTTKKERVWREAMKGRDLIIIDALRPSMPGIDENSSLFRAGLDFLASMSVETGCRALVIHHGKKLGPDGVTRDGRRESIRGTSGIPDACDNIMVFYGKKYAPFEVTTEKTRTHGRDVEPFWLLIEDTLGHRGLRCSQLDEDAAREVMKASKAETQLAADQEAVRAALVAAGPDGLGTEALKKAARLNGSRCAAAVSAWGDDIRIQGVKSGRAIVRAHVWAGEG